MLWRRHDCNPRPPRRPPWRVAPGRMAVAAALNREGGRSGTSSAAGGGAATGVQRATVPANSQRVAATGSPAQRGAATGGWPMRSVPVDARKRMRPGLAVSAGVAAMNMRVRPGAVAPLGLTAEVPQNRVPTKCLFANLMLSQSIFLLTELRWLGLQKKNIQ